MKSIDELKLIHREMQKPSFIVNMYSYIEMEYTHPIYPKTVYMIGETHNYDKCNEKLQSTIEQEDMIRTIQHTSDKPVDIFVESNFPSKIDTDYTPNLNVNVSTMTDYRHRCFKKLQCDFTNARIHYIDVRNLSSFLYRAFSLGNLKWNADYPENVFDIYALLLRPNIFDEIKRYIMSVFDGDVTNNPIYKIETANLSATKLKLPYVSSKMALYLDKKYQKRRKMGSFYRYLYSDYKYQLNKIQKQYRNCEPSFVEQVKKGVAEFIEYFRIDFTTRLPSTIASIQDYFKKDDTDAIYVSPWDGQGAVPIFNIFVIFQDIYGIGRMFRTKWNKPHKYSKNQVLYVGGHHAYTTYLLLRYVPGIRLKAISTFDPNITGNNCSKVVKGEHSKLEKIFNVYSRLHSIPTL
jgi:hypothetical protein